MSTSYPPSVSFENPRLPGKSAAPSSLEIPGRKALSPAGGKELPVLAGRVDAAEVTAAIEQLNEYARNIHRQLEFSVDQDLNQVIVRVYNADTEELIRQIPSEEALILARRMAVDGGLFFDERA